MVFDLAGLLRSLTDGNVDFVVIGGIAVAAHAFVRATEDLDVVQRLPGVPAHSELRRDATEVTLHGVRFSVCSRAQLVAMKRARGSALDQADLERLGDG